MDSVKLFKLSSGHFIPSIGLGTAGITDKNLIINAINCGYRHFDCATVYGNQAVLGDVFSQLIDQDRTLTRDQLFLTSKLPANGMGKVEYFLMKTLEEFKTNYVDLYLIHIPFSTKYISDNLHYPIDQNGELLCDTDVNYLDTWKEMERLVDKGLIRSIGVSNFNVDQLTEILDNCSIKPSVLQVEVHAYHQQKSLVNFCKENDIMVTAFGSLGSPKKANQLGAKPLLEDEIITSLSAKYKKSNAQILLNWLNMEKIVAVPNSENVQQLMENISVFDFQLEQTDFFQIRTLDKNERLHYFDYAVGIRDHKDYPFKK